MATADNGSGIQTNVQALLNLNWKHIQNDWLRLDS
jgi:hypothetical protein